MAMIFQRAAFLWRNSASWKKRRMAFRRSGFLQNHSINFLENEHFWKSMPFSLESTRLFLGEWAKLRKELNSPVFQSSPQQFGFQKHGNSRTRAKNRAEYGILFASNLL